MNGAGYTDVHARLPAETLLVVVSIFAGRDPALQHPPTGLDPSGPGHRDLGFVALTVGIVYPALLQTLKVTPAQSSLEAPYIERNITATRDASR